MKIFSALAWLAASIFFLPFAAISQCSPTAKGIYTDPQSPYWANPEVNPNWQTTNNGLFGRKNTFDWTAENINIYKAPNGASPIGGPCRDLFNSVIAPIRQAQDYKSEDGWEMVFWDTGLKDDGITPYPTTPTDPRKPIVVLYNKFTGLLRVFGVVRLDGGQSYNMVKVDLSLPSVNMTSFRHASLLDASGIAALLSPMDRFVTDGKANVKMSSISEYLNDQYHWFYADFPMTYDPCTCDWLSQIGIKVYLVSSMDINMISQSTGTATPISGLTPATDSSTTSNKFVFGEHLADAAEASWKSYENINNFVEEAQKRINEASGSTEVKKEAKGAVDKLTKALSSKEWGALSKGLAFVPYVGAAVSLISAFTAGGKKEVPTTISMPPLTLHSTATYQGTITRTDYFIDVQFWNPGSKHQPDAYQSQYPVGSAGYINQIEGAMRYYPLYNRTMGILNLVTTPKLEVYTSPLLDESTYSFDTSRYKYNIYCKKSQNRYFKLAPIEYALNPESELEIQEIYAAFVLDAYPNIFPPKGSFWNKLGNTYQSEFIPLSSLTGQGFGGKSSAISDYFYPGYPGEIPNFADCSSPMFPDNFDQTVKLKLMFNLKRTDQYAGPETQNVLWVGTYPVKTEATTTPILPSVLNTSVLNGSQILKNTLLQNITINSDIYCWDTLRIGPGVTFTNTTPITLQAGQVIEISPTVEIPTNVTLLIAPLFPHTGFPAPMTYTNIRTYCQTAYSQARSSKSNSKTLEEPTLAQPIIAPALSAQPNPFSEMLTLRFGPETGTLTVYDVLGRAISSSEVAADQQQLDLSTAEWQPGVYIAVYETAAGRQAVRVVRQ